MNTNDIVQLLGQFFLFASGVSLIGIIVAIAIGAYMAITDAVKKNNVVKNGFC